MFYEKNTAQSSIKDKGERAERELTKECPLKEKKYRTAFNRIQRGCGEYRTAFNKIQREKISKGMFYKKKYRTAFNKVQREKINKRIFFKKKYRPAFKSVQ